MAEPNISAMLVMDQECLVGIHPERDYIRHVVLRGCTAKDTQVSEIIFSRPICVGPDQTVEEWIALMNRKWVRYLPGVENDRVLGFISIGDAVQTSISQQQSII